MQTIKELLNKIKWDKNETPESYVLYYEDRIEKQLKPIKFKDVKRVEDNFLVLENDMEETYIPLHRVKKVKTNGKTVWMR